ncbi:AMP-dependent synthetase/ligase [Pseudonocardia xinjiangensis]|uniref:AMP-dependent synthetase/ligase n=1 Tax=Pseudonocardia xinjiangensis TaxID=75289 RepID=UPI003D8BA690
MSTPVQAAPAALTSTNPGGPDLPDDVGLAHLLDLGLARDPDAVALSRLGPDGWEDRTWAQLHDDVAASAARLLGRGLRPGDRVAILGRTSYAWAVADLAAALVGLITVPIFPTSSPAQMRHILTDSGATACLAEDGGEGDVPSDGRGGVAVLSLDGLVEPDRDPGGWGAVEPADPTAARAAVRASSVASIVYTSGTTALPKGCVLTHRNLFAAAAAVVEHCTELFADRDAGQPATIVGLPLAHVFGRTVLQAGLYSGSRTALAPGVPEMVGQLAAFEPTWLAVVPYALEKLRKGIVAAGGPPGRHPMLGTALRHVICGGARLDAPIAEFFAGHGVTVLQAYGLTESATAVSVNIPATNRIGTVGRPVPGTTVAIAEDGELLVRGRQVSPGYWPDPQPAADGWLHTGDLAALDPDGFLRITGRRKEILVTTGGKNVAPVPLEDRLRLHPLVASAMVVAEGRPYVTALLALDHAAVLAWARRHRRAADPASLVADPELRAELTSAVDAANELVSRAESIRRFAVLTEDFTVTAGHLTPTLKMRRDVIEDAFRAQVEGLYP